jgi:hypothetical protein
MHIQEVKQIAGRAGRFGTAYAQGVVATLHEADRDYLRHCLLQPYESVPAAGIFPSRPQLELLGALLDNRVHSSEQLRGFWEDFFAHCGGGAGGGLVVEFSAEDMFRPEFIREHFSSMRDFSLHLARFMHMENDHTSFSSSSSSSYAFDDSADQEIGFGGRRRRGGRKKQQQQFKAVMDSSRFPRTPLSTLLEVFRHSVSFPLTAPRRSDDTDDSSAAAAPPAPKSRKNLKTKTKTKGKGKGKAERSRQEEQEQEQLSATGRRPLYFVSDLDETRQVARVLEKVSVSVPSSSSSPAVLSFQDLYTFSLAPVSVDNPEVVRALTVIAEQYLLVSVSAERHQEREEEEEGGGLKVCLPKKYFKINR